ncbi:hypothetical protein HZA87_05545 [Candidatus Uhrbacteria bacterium]|nr:hypothetical protein [Candidatus Uhrbacteria bacterium]
MNDSPARRADSDMVPLGKILPDVMADLIERARKAGHPPPPFVTDRFQRPKPPTPSPR